MVIHKRKGLRVENIYNQWLLNEDKLSIKKNVNRKLLNGFKLWKYHFVNKSDYLKQ